MNLFAKWLLVALSLLLTAFLLPGVEVDGLYPALIAALLLGLVNVFLRPIVIILTLPINILTLGLFTFVINGLLLWFISSFIQGFSIDGFFTAVLASLLISLISFVGDKLFSKLESDPEHESY